MEVYYQLVKDDASLIQACKLFSSSEYVGLDTETTGLDPYQGKLRLLQLSNGRETRIIDLIYFGGGEGPSSLCNNERLMPLRDLIRSSKPVKVIHNAKFDAKWIYHCLGVETGSLFDTYLASQLLWFGDQDRRHGLAEVASQFLNISVDKTEQRSDWSISELTDSQLRYAAKDAIVVWQLYGKIGKSLEEKGLTEVARIEFDCVMPLVAMEINGFYLDSSALKDHLRGLEKQQQKLLGELKAELSQTSLFETFTRQIKRNSSEEISDFLRRSGVPISSEMNPLELELLAVNYPIVGKVLEYLKITNVLSGLGEEFLGAVNQTTNRVHPDFRQIMNPFARIGYRSNKLHKFAFDRYYDYCFSAPVGKSLIILDCPLIETAIVAYLSGEQKFIEALKSDFYKQVALEMFGSSDEELVLVAKILHQVVFYGVGASYFEKITDCITHSDAENLMRLYFQCFPKLYSWFRQISDTVENERGVRSAFGRIYQFCFNERVSLQRLAAIRLARAFVIQATLTDILKMTLTNLYYGLKGSSAKLVNFACNQIWIECEQEDEKAVLTKACSIVRNILRDKLGDVMKEFPVRARVFKNSSDCQKPENQNA